MIEIDARNLDCPGPVLKVKKEIEEGSLTSCRVLLNTESSKQNVSRLAKTLGFSFTVETHGDNTVITMQKNGSSPEAVQAVREKPAVGNVTVLVGSDVLGSGSDELGAKLIHSLLATIREVKPLPAKILFVNGGVRLTTGDSPAIAPLKELEERGVEIFSCGACLEYFGLMDQLGVGGVGNMLITLEALFGASSVIRL